jgi:predicted enzyme related to lactoylglutathione lyase
MSIKIQLTSVFVDDQAKALAFYTDVLGFAKKTDIPVGEYSFVTVVDETGSVELLLEPNNHPAAQAFQRAIYADGIPATAFIVDDIHAEYERLRNCGVVFQGEPMQSEMGWDVTFDDTSGNLIALHQNP